MAAYPGQRAPTPARLCCGGLATTHQLTPGAVGRRPTCAAHHFTLLLTTPPHRQREECFSSPPTSTSTTSLLSAQCSTVPCLPRNRRWATGPSKRRGNGLEPCFDSLRRCHPQGVVRTTLGTPEPPPPWRAPPCGQPNFSQVRPRFDLLEPRVAPYVTAELVCHPRGESSTAGAPPASSALPAFHHRGAISPTTTAPSHGPELVPPPRALHHHHAPPQLLRWLPWPQVRPSAIG
jgi:hypothetical protein